MISEEAHYKYVGSVIKHRLDQIRDAFRLFLQLFSAIVGGSIWLSIQVAEKPSRHTYARVSDLLVALLTLVTAVMVSEALRGWWGYRKTLSRFDTGQHRIPMPRKRSLVTEIVMVACMVGAAVVFVWFNPFTFSSG
jgi:hypothetical protein